MLTEGAISKIIESFLTQQVKEEITSPQKQAASIKAFSDTMEKAIYTAIKSQTLTIAPGTVIVVGSPATQTNAIPIVLTPDPPVPTLTIQ